MKYGLTRFAPMVIAWSVISVAASAQVPIEATVSASQPYTDHVALAKDVDLLVRFTFDEAANTLTAEVKSYADLFVFADRARYGKTIFLRKFRPDRLPFPVVSQPKSRYKVTSSFRHSISGKKKRRHVFRSWMECEGIVPQQREYSMVNDRIVQTFSIPGPEDTVATVCLRELCVLQPRKKEGRYRLTACTDLARNYHVSIQRDWCFGHQEEIEAERARLDNMRNAYDSLAGKYGSGVASSEEALGLFTAIRNVVLQQNEHMPEQNRCATIAHLRHEYNCYVDSLASMNVTLPQQADTEAKGVDVERMLRRTRELDRSVARWLITHDNVEKRDIEVNCDTIVVSGRREIRANGIFGDEQQEACSTFEKAVRYYKKTCER